MTYFSKLTRSTRAKGFTLTELLIVIAIVSVLATVAVPSFSRMIRSMAVRGAADELTAGIQLARSEAARTNRKILIVIKDRTWQVFSDNNGNNQFDGGDELLRTTTYSDQIAAQSSELRLEFSASGTTSIFSGNSTVNFPAGVCLKSTADPGIARSVQFQARATSPVIQGSCS